MHLSQFRERSVSHIKKRKKSYLWLLLILVVILFLFFYTRWTSDPNEVVQKEDIIIVELPAAEPEPIVIQEPVKKFIPKNFTMETLKKKGCVADGFLSEYGEDTAEMIELINRSECTYLHRALETWRSSPDFNRAQEIMVQIEKPVVFGMFIAEAISKKIRYYDSKRNENFDFRDMCRKGTDNYWGEHTCKPSFAKKDYQRYLQFITERAMDAGIQSFLFGQVYFQEEGSLEKSALPKIVQKMRDYAKKKDLQIVIGAQTGYITDDQYLKMFDFIEGGVGMTNSGSIERGPCLSWRGGCWALLWHSRFRNRANNVFIHLDWSGIHSDDMSRFARMDASTRGRTLDYFYQYFTSRDMAFLMPMLSPLYKDNGGCYGPKKKFYSPSNEYSCKDEDLINRILRGE